ncbi:MULTISPECIES: hypothetical protein [Streptomyces]|uniref:Uncharacterized protein n=2 Tax=Streptomyces TaxID=1883 RepID=A0A2U9PCY8_STRAS|nr:hypothetical protein [Streptomyces actuosus]AWT46824.1 hypothetical protein DMT42_34185 [Streptomyces actuosus]MBM4824030.1 hypothetical protein [Streptomyces actuosus]
MPRANTAPIQINLPPGIATNLVVAGVVFGMGITAVVLREALYGTPETSERAFRLMNWLKREPGTEHAQPSPTARSRTTVRAGSVRAASASEIKR